MGIIILHTPFRRADGIVRISKSFPSREIYKKMIENSGNLRYNYNVLLILSRRDTGGEMRYNYGKKSRNRLQRHSLPHYSRG